MLHLQHTALQQGYDDESELCNNPAISYPDISSSLLPQSCIFISAGSDECFVFYVTMCSSKVVDQWAK